MEQTVEQPTATPLTEHKRLYEALYSLPESILSASGRFLYSDISSLRPGKFYLLGYNPGGDPGKIITPLRDEISKWGTTNTNAYLDEVWRHSPQAGGSPYQRNVRELCDALGICPRDVCASNLFFTRSISAAALKVGKENPFWPVHEVVLDIVMPECILAIGLNTYSTIARLLEFNEKRTFHSGHGTWYCRVAEGQYRNRSLKLIGFPHFSRYSLKGRVNVLAQIAEECSRSGRMNGNHP